MYLRYYLDQQGNKCYTLKSVLEDGNLTFNPHPAKFSPDDKYSKQRIQCKKRYNLLLIDMPKLTY